jgi:hypothetical protein
MIGKTEPIVEFLFGEVREPLYLIKTVGNVFPFMDCYVPKIFREALIDRESFLLLWKSLQFSDKRGIKGWKAGGRSGLVYYKGIWYDIEGVRPTEKEWRPGIPEGGDTKEEAENELNAGALFFDYGMKNNIPSLMKPICLFEYTNIKFKGEPLYAPVLTTKGDYRLNNLLGDYLEVAKEAYERLQNLKKPLRDAKIDRITDNIKEGLTNKIGQWTGWWYCCLEKNNHLWGTNYVKNPDETYEADSNVGNNNLAVYRLNDGVAIGINDLNGYLVPDQKRRGLEIDRLKKRLSIWEGTLHLLKHGKSAINISQYQTLQTWASKIYTGITPPRGINIFQKEVGYDPFGEIELPKVDEFDIIKSFNEGRSGKKPELIDERYITNIKEMFLT